MNRSTAWSVHGAALAAGGTGLVYAWMRWLCEPEDEFSIANHPLEPDLKSLHILAGPLLVFAVGLLWRAHVWGRIRTGMKERRFTGILLAILFPPAVASGYLMQTAESADWQLAWIWVHGVSSIAWVLLYLAHQFGPNPAAARRRGRSAREPLQSRG